MRYMCDKTYLVSFNSSPRKMSDFRWNLIRYIRGKVGYCATTFIIRTPMLWIKSKIRILLIVSSKTAALIWYFEHFAPCIRSRFIDTGLDQRYDIILPNQIWFYNAQCTIFRDIYRVVVLINHYHIHQSHTHGQKYKHIYEYRNVNCAFLLVMSNDT